MINMANEGITMWCVTHGMGFAKAIAERVSFMDQGQIVEQNNPHKFFSNPQNERCKDFLSTIIDPITRRKFSKAHHEYLDLRPAT